MAAFQLCPFSHFHHTLLLDPAITWFGVSGAFFWISHSEAIFGSTVARSFSPSITLWPAQYGQPWPLFRLDITASHSCPFLHTHHELCCLPDRWTVTSSTWIKEKVQIVYWHYRYIDVESACHYSREVDRMFRNAMLCCQMCCMCMTHAVPICA